MTEHATTEHATTEHATETAGQYRPDSAADQAGQYSPDAGPGEPVGQYSPETGPVELTPENEDVVEALRDVVDPELGINVVDLGLVSGVTVGEDRIATIDMTLTSAACPLTDVIEDQTRDALEGLVNDFRINWVWLPPWGPDKITEDGREQLRALGFNV